MKPIDLNHSRYLMSLKSEGITGNDLVLDSSSKQNKQIDTSDLVSLSSASKLLYEFELPTSRFGSMAEQSASKTKQINSWITLEELESGVRKPFSDPEAARLSTLSLYELMVESNNLPNMDEHGHLQSSFAGTEQGDKISNAVADILLKSQYTYEEASENVSKSLQEFKEYVESRFDIDPNTYTIQFKDGKITAVTTGGNALANDETQKVQSLLDDPKHYKEAKQLVSDITNYNEAASTLINNKLVIMTVGGAQNRYLPKEVSVNQIMEGMDYSNTESTSHLYNKWVGSVAQANEKYQSALKDGSHLEYAYKDTPGLLELTKMREANKGLS